MKLKRTLIAVLAIVLVFGAFALFDTVRAQTYTIEVVSLTPEKPVADVRQQVQIKLRVTKKGKGVEGHSLFAISKNGGTFKGNRAETDEEGEEYGGQNKYGELPRFWYNWGSWRVANPVPNFASQKFRELIVHNLKEGFLKPLNERYNKLKKEDKAYLFAGCAVGWETHIPDYSADNRMLNLSVNNLPKDYATGKPMYEWELAQYGYGALHSLGYDQAKIDAEAAEKGISSKQHIKNILYQVIHDYSEMLAKTVYEAGVPRTKIFTHTVSCQTTLGNESTFYPPIWTAVNDYSTPGYTMSPVTCKYDLKKMKQQLFEADPNFNEFACAEGYAAGLDTVAKCDAYFKEMFENGARNVTAFGYPDVGVPVFEFRRDPDFPYIISTNNWLRGDLQ